MSRRDPRYRLQHMLDYAREAHALAETRSRELLDNDRLFSLALVRLLEVVGEAASQIPQEERGRYPAVPWSGITRFRNRMIHGYDAIDLDIVWTIATDDLPPLILQLESILASVDKTVEPGSESGAVE